MAYLGRAGFDPRAMSSFLAKLKWQSDMEAAVRGGSPRPALDFFTTRPRTRERVERAAVTALAGGLDGGGARLAAVRFQRDTVARFLFTPAAAPGTALDGRYRAAAYSFRRLRDGEARSVRPWRIAIHEAGPGDTVKSLVDRRFAAGVDAPYRTFRLLNGLRRGEPRAGDRVKLIVEGQAAAGRG